MNINNFLSIFKKYFQFFMKIHSDKRAFDLLPYDSKGYFSNFVKPDDRYTFSCLYDLIRIEIYYKEENIIESYISNKKFPLNDKISSEIAQYLATHEYGHTFFCDSIYTSKILLEHQLQLKNDYNFLFLVQLFNEFTADWHAKRMIVRLPEMLITMFLEKFKTILGNFFITNITHTLPSTPRNLNFFDYYQWEFTELVRIYVFNQWDKVLPLFNLHFLTVFTPFIPLQLYCKKLFQALQQLYNQFNREDLILRGLIKLGEKLSEITLWDLVSGQVNLETIRKYVY